MPFARAVGRVIIKRLVPTGLGSNAILRAIQRSGNSYRRTDMLADVRQISGLHKYEKAVRNVGTNEVIPKGYMVNSDLKQPYKYRVYGKTNYYDPDTDSYVTVSESFYTDDLAKKGDWEEIYSKSYDDRYPEGGMEFTNFNITSIEHHVGYSY